MYANAVKKLVAVLCAISMILICADVSQMSVSAKDKDGTFTVICKDNGEPISDMVWKVYRVGKRGKGNSYNLDGNFKNYKVSVNHSDASEAAKTGLTLENYAVLDKIKPDFTGVTDKSGVLKFEGLKTGLYIASGTKLKVDTNIYTPSVVMFEIHETINEGYTGKDITAYVKMTTTVLKDQDIEFSYTVKNVWENDDKNEQRPNKVKVEIYRDGDLYLEIELSDENNWTHKWDGSPDSDWRVKVDTVPDDYTVIYDSDDTNFAVVNTYNPNIPDNPGFIDPPTTETIFTTVITETTTDISDGSSAGTDIDGSTTSVPAVTTVSLETSSDKTSTVTVVTENKSTVAQNTTTTKEKSESISGGKLPQTGQLWWPVLLLGGIGVVVISCGIKLRCDGKRDDDE